MPILFKCSAMSTQRKPSPTIEALTLYILPHAVQSSTLINFELHFENCRETSESVILDRSPFGSFQLNNSGWGHHSIFAQLRGVKGSRFYSEIHTVDQDTRLLLQEVGLGNKKSSEQLRKVRRPSGASFGNDQI